MFSFAIPAVVSLLFGRARAAITGPASGALVATGVALVLVGGLALGLHWLRGDAWRDAQAVCQAEQLARELETANTKAAAIAEALDQASHELRRREEKQKLTEAQLQTQAATAERLRDDVAKLESAAGAARALCLPDDRWLRSKRADRPADKADR